MAQFRYRPARRLLRFDRRNGARIGTIEKCRSDPLPIPCAAGDLQQLLPGHCDWRILRRSSWYTASGSRFHPCGAEAAKPRSEMTASPRTEHAEPMPRPTEQVVVLRMEGPNGRA